MSKNDDDKIIINHTRLSGEAPLIVTEIVDNCMYSGFYGTLDSSRMKSIIDKVSSVAESTEIDNMIIDLSNIEIIDSTIASQFNKLTKILRVVGMELIYCGIRPIVAQSMINAGIDLDNILLEKNLKTAIKRIYKKQGLKLVPMNA